MNQIQNTSDFLSRNTTENQALLFLIVISCILLVLLSIAVIYLISVLRRGSIILKKVDYLVEDVIYKSEALNVTVETLNKLSSYLLSFDAISQKGFKSLFKLISENRNYILSLLGKLKEDVEKNEKKIKERFSEKKEKAKSKTTEIIDKKTNPKKPTTKKTNIKQKTTSTKSTTKKQTTKSTTNKKTNSK